MQVAISSHTEVALPDSYEIQTPCQAEFNDPCDSNYRLLERPWKIFKTITLQYILQDEAQAVTVKLDSEWFIHDSLASISASSATDLNLERIQIPHSNLLCKPLNVLFKSLQLVGPGHAAALAKFKFESKFDLLAALLDTGPTSRLSQSC